MTNDITLDYESRKARRKRFRPVSIWLIALQLPYAVVILLVLPEHAKGAATKLVADSVTELLFLFPAILAMPLAMAELWHRKQESRTPRRVALSVVALIVSTAVVVLAAIAWYRTLWLNRHGFW
jgi:hypothetical protein